MADAKKVNQIIAAIIATVYAFATGIALGWTNPIEPKAKDGKLGFSIDEEEFSWVGSAFPLGAVAACIPYGFLVDAIGRKISAIIMVIPYALGWCGTIFGNQSWMLILSRVILGIASGATCVVIPMYIGEISQKEIRGALGSCFQLQITIGILFIYVIGAFLEPKLMNGICLIFPCLATIGMLFIPESPLFLIKKDKNEKAQRSIEWFRGKEYDASPEINSFKEDVLKSKERSSFFAGFKNPACKKALYISLGLMFFQQFSGINAVIFYSTEIFRYAGSTLEPRYSTIVIGVVQVIATCFAVVFVDRLGRRLLLMISAAVMALSTLILGVYFFLLEKDKDAVKGIGWIPITALCIYIIMFSFGFGPVPWITVGELFPPEVKGPAGSLAGTSNWLFAFVVAKVYPSMKNGLGAGQTFWLFSALTLMGFIFVLFLVPETKNKSLSEIQEMLQD